MSQPLDELHHIITQLEGEGHALAGRAHDVLERLKADWLSLAGGGRIELETFLQGLIATLAPELDKVKADAVGAVVAEVRKIAAEVKAALDNALIPAPAPAPVEPAQSPAPAQG